MEELLDELRRRAWIATALMVSLAAACASLHLAFPAAVAAMAAGALLMWKSEEVEEEQPSMAAMLAQPDAAVPDPAPAAAPAFRPAA